MRGIDPTSTLLGLTSMFTDLASEMVTSVIPPLPDLGVRVLPGQFGAFDGLYQGMAPYRLWAALFADRDAPQGGRRRRLLDVRRVRLGLL